MGQFAIPVRASSPEPGAPRDNGEGRPARSPGEALAAAAADSETRRVLGMLRVALDRLPE